MLKISKRRWLGFLGVILLTVGAWSAADADEIVERVAIHGYGWQGFLRSTGNPYLTADPVNKGSWDYNTLPLVFTAKLDSKTMLWLQLHTTSERARIMWSYVDHQVNNNFNWRVGQIMLPVGLYNETRDIKFLQQSTLEPILYQMQSEFVDESYRGAAGIYNRDLGAGSIVMDVYGGQGLREMDTMSSTDMAGTMTSTTRKYHRLTGARITYNTPVEGLRVMASAYNSQMDLVTSVTPFATMTITTTASGSKKVTVYSVDYLANNLDLKAEYAKRSFFDMNGMEQLSSTYYTQAGYTFADKWTPFARFDYINTDKAQKNDPSYYQRSKVLGLNYRINDGLSVRMENHWNKGYALPVASMSVMPGTGVDTWKMFVAGLVFIF